ncbi:MULTISPECIES: hypothetical protein [unclassified Ekhidna]|jgi:hypothetical protein|uniref:hypothetical protein n=1 Tax=unclassified Ekhidna TaxID=2632188 RepID=UPI0032DE2CA3
MRHALILILVALITISIVLVIYRPDLLEDVWLWLVGLIGPIIGFVKAIVKSISNFFKSLDNA